MPLDKPARSSGDSRLRCTSTARAPVPTPPAGSVAEKADPATSQTATAAEPSLDRRHHAREGTRVGA